MRPQVLHIGSFLLSCLFCGVIWGVAVYMLTGDMHRQDLLQSLFFWSALPACLVLGPMIVWMASKGVPRWLNTILSYYLGILLYWLLLLIADPLVGDNLRDTPWSFLFLMLYVGTLWFGAPLLALCAFTSSILLGVYAHFAPESRGR